MNFLYYLQILINFDEKAYLDNSLPSEKRFASLIQETQSVLIHFSSGLVGSLNHEAEDFVQEAYIKFHQKVKKEGWSSIDNPLSWLFRVVRNLITDAGRRKVVENRYKELRVDQELEKQNSQKGQIDVHIDGEIAEVVMSAIKNLDSEEREIVMLKVLQNFTLREISEITGIKLGTVAYRLNNSLTALQNILKSKGIV